MKYVKTSLLVTFLSCTFFSFAQYDPKPGDKQIVLGFGANNSLVMLRKFKTETICNRYKLNLYYNIDKNSSKGIYNGSLEEAIGYNFGFSGSFGKQKNFKINDKLVPYLALDLSIGSNYFQSKRTSSIYDTSIANKSRRDQNNRIISMNSVINSNKCL